MYVNKTHMGSLFSFVIGVVSVALIAAHIVWKDLASYNHILLTKMQKRLKEKLTTMDLF